MDSQPNFVPLMPAICDVIRNSASLPAFIFTVSSPSSFSVPGCPNHNFTMMHRWLPAFPYPPQRKGYWEPVTSTINWCEEDYYATIYSAELVNAFTNLLFMGLGIRGIRNCLKYGHDTIFTVCFCGYILVGTGSFFFHSTLKYPWQLVDELSMIYTTCLMCYAVFSYKRSRSFSVLLAASLLGLSVFITIYYHYLQEPTFHQIAYGLLTAAVVFRSMYVMEVNLRPSLRKKYGTNPVRENAELMANPENRAEMERRDKDILADMWWMIAVGLSIFLGGFGIWALDLVYCSAFRQWRHEIGLPWGIFLEGHGWWHLMTGTGAYFDIVWGIWLRHCLNGRQDDFELRWLSIFSMPDIVPARRNLEQREKKESLLLNGESKKRL